MRVQATTVRAPAATRSVGHALRWLGAALLLLLVLAALVGLAFSGSKNRLATGIAVDGVDVGGLSHDEALRVLERRAAAVAKTPVVFTAGERSFPIKAATVGVEADWEEALSLAAAESSGFGPIRGYKRLRARFLGVEIDPPVQAYSAALQYKLSRLGTEIDRHHVEAQLVRRGLSVVLVPEQSGLALDRKAAADTIVAALSRLDRSGPVALPLTIEPAKVTSADLAQATRQARLALSAPIRLQYGQTRWKLPRWRIAQLLSLPDHGATRLAIAGPAADAWFAKLKGTVEREPANATWEVVSGGIVTVPAKPGVGVDVTKTAKAILAAATTRGDRVAQLAVTTTAPERSTAEAKAMGITGIVGSYSTTYGGIAERLHNVALVAKLIDGTLVGPGKTFSFNGTTGERTAEKGFEEAPVIINGELENGLGGGVCQVSTTLFNAAYEGGLQIDSRTNHALYISHYPLGRDATVNYPDLDLKFTNDTDKWILVRTFVGSGSLTVNLYGAPQDRVVETSASPLAITGPPAIKKVPDPSRFVGETSVESYGQPSRATSVHRVVRSSDGTVLHEDTWYSTYQSEPKVVLVGTKPKPKPVPEPIEPAKPAKPGKAADGDAADPAAPAAVPTATR